MFGGMDESQLSPQYGALVISYLQTLGWALRLCLVHLLELPKSRTPTKWIEPEAAFSEAAAFA